MKIKYYIAFTTLLCLGFISCNKKNLGNYVYIDTFGVLHVDNHCHGIVEIGNSKPVTAISTNELYDIGDVCAECVSENEYEKLMYRIDIHRKMNPNRRK